MALQISEASGVFSVFGELNSQNAAILKRHMTNFIKKDNRVILNLERVKFLDLQAALTIKQLFMEAIGRNSIFSIVATENESVLSVMEENKISYIISPDRY